MKAKNRRIAYLGVTGVVVLTVLAVATAVANSQANNLDLVLGRGKQSISESTLDANYINFTYNDPKDAQDKALKNAQDMTRETAEEGMTLLKNAEVGGVKALPLAATDGVTVLGYYSWHNNMSGGEDPATTSGAVSLANGIEAAFGEKFNSATKALYNNAGADFADPATSLASAEGTFAQFPTAIITLKRNSGEGNDQTKVGGASEQSRSGLVITNAELKLIDYACQHFDKVIIVVNSANAMELGWLQETDPNMNAGKYRDPYTGTEYDFSKVQAAIWAGCCGSQGGTALAEILLGQVNPSGHLVDTYVRDLRKDPTYPNFGSFLYSNSDEFNSYQDETYFVEYEEGIYVGYRYYETAAKEAMEGHYAGFDYNNQVVFPFGYGLSYTEFSREYAEQPSFNAETNEYTFKVKVTNEGTVAGKGVAQIYVNVPYIQGGVEKSHVTLVGFGKTQVLAGGASEVLEIKVNRDYFTSFDYKNEKAYILDAGDYNFYLSDNAHSWAEIDGLDATEKAKVLWTDTLASKLVFTEEKDGKRPTDLSVAVNKEDEELNFMFVDYDNEEHIEHGEGKAINFSRKDFQASFPEAPKEDDLELTDERALKYIAKYDVWAEENNPIADEDMPTVDTDPTRHTLASMRGVDWDDAKWDDYMNQFTRDSMVKMVTNGGWNELADSENGVPVSYDADSPYGYYAAALSIKNVNKWYCGGPMVAATFNTELAKKVGDAFGEEAHANYLAGGSLITGVYGFGLNMHRSAFGGRNYEYYSEDGILAGKMAAAESSGASEKGLICFMKHYCLNDQETNRQKNGYCAWVNEQAFREVYVKGWELYMKEAKMNVNYYKDGESTLSTKEMSAATGIMTSYNRIGATWGGASISLKAILVDEFGFTGTAITDAGGQKHTYMTSDFMLRRGGHLTLTNNGSDGLYDTKSATATYYLKDATKHILFNKANSNCVQGIAPDASISYGMAPWRIGFISAWIVVGVLAAADLTFIVLIALGVVKVKERKEPKEEY